MRKGKGCVNAQAPSSNNTYSHHEVRRGCLICRTGSAKSGGIGTPAVDGTNRALEAPLREKGAIDEVMSVKGVKLKRSCRVDIRTQCVDGDLCNAIPVVNVVSVATCSMVVLKDATKEVNGGSVSLGKNSPSLLFIEFKVGCRGETRTMQENT